MSAAQPDLWPWQRAPFDVAKRLLLWLVTGVVCISGYGLTKLEPYGAPVYLPLSAIDLAIPLIPWTVWPYGTVTWAALLAWLAVPDRIAGRRLLASMALASVICWFFFAFFPTTFPRELWPTPAGDSLTLQELRVLRDDDTPANCFPSMHVALAWSLAGTCMAFASGRIGRWLPFFWAVGVSVFTLTTKQHYLLDVAGGIAVGVIAWWVAHRGITAETPAFWTRLDQRVSLEREADQRAVAAMRARVEAHQWSLDDIPWPEAAQPPLPDLMVRLLNQVIYIEEIAGLNFRFQEEASADPDLKRLYGLFADEERRHAEGLRKILAMHGHGLEGPGLGNALVLDQFDDLDPASEADQVLVAMSTPVFETFLDAGTIPFLQAHPALRGPAFDAFVERVGRDEAQHMALNWLVTRDAARRLGFLRGLKLLFNPAIYRGMLAVPWMSLDVYSLAHRLGYRFETLLPAFGRLWRLHRRYPELASFPLWWSYRLFTLCGAIATFVCVWQVRLGLMWGALWTTVTAVTDRLAWALFGARLLEKRGLPSV